MTAINSKLSALFAKLETAKAAVTKIEQQIAAAQVPVPSKGEVVSFMFGRGEKQARMSGSVITTSVGDNGVTYVSVLVNEDTLPEVKRVPVKDLLGPATVEAAAADTEVSDGGVPSIAGSPDAGSAEEVEVIDPLADASEVVADADHDAAIAELLGQ